MVQAVRNGASQRDVARHFGVRLQTVQHWVKRAGGKRIDRVDFSTHSSRPRHVARKTPEAIITKILTARSYLKEQSILGEYGAEAIHRHLIDEGLSGVPSPRTINRILDRHGAFDGKRRRRTLPPPKGWHLADVRESRAEMDCFDIIEGLVIENGPLVEVLNAISLLGGLPDSWPRDAAITAAFSGDCIIAHWREHGLPSYAQFDNDTVFQGPHQHRDVVSRVMRICLSLKVVPVFAPPREHGFQNAIEGYNARWQDKLWARYHFRNFNDLITHSSRYVDAMRQRHAHRIADAPERRPFPTDWVMDLQRHPTGRIVFLRRTTEVGSTVVLGRTFQVDPKWCNRLVRGEVDLSNDHLAFYALLRRHPNDQPLLNEYTYKLPNRPFTE